MRYDNLFNDLEITTDPFALCELKGQCNIGLSQDASATLHYILSGEGEIAFANQPPLRVARGSLVLIPALLHHSLRSYGTSRDPVPECQPAQLHLARLMAGEGPTGGDQMTALCGRIRVGLRGVSDVIDLIREPLVERIGETSAMQGALQGLLCEISNPKMGSRAMIRALLTQCVIEMLRKRLATGRQLEWMAALADPMLWNALRAMLDEPGANHSVESLAESVFMSRSAFAKRFTEAYGSGPMDLLRALRMRQAAALLRDTDLPVKRIAEMVGFASRSAFTRSFEANTDLSPRAFRQLHRGG